MVNETDFAPYWVVENQDVIQWAKKPRSPKFIKSVSMFVSAYSHMTHRQHEVVTDMLTKREVQGGMLDRLLLNNVSIPIVDSFRETFNDGGHLTDRQFKVLKRIYNGKVGEPFTHTYGSYEP